MRTRCKRFSNGSMILTKALANKFHSNILRKDIRTILWSHSILLALSLRRRYSVKPTSASFHYRPIWRLFYLLKCVQCFLTALSLLTKRICRWCSRCESYVLYCFDLLLMFVQWQTNPYQTPNRNVKSHWYVI